MVKLRFCLLWDNFLIPGNMIVNADMKMKKALA